MEEENITELLKEIFGTKFEIIQAKISHLTKPGDHNLSVMYKVDVVLKNDDKSSQAETLHLVAKCAKTSNAFVKELYPVAFKNEINFYKVIVPTLESFQKERGVLDVIDLYPKFYGAKLNKSGGNEVDENVVLILENLKSKNFHNIDRYLGFDLEQAKFIIKDLATLHATALGLKFTKTEEFEDKVKKNCKKAIPYPSNEDKNSYNQPLTVLFEILEDYNDCRRYIPSLKNNFAKMRKVMDEFFEKPPREPFATLVHCDMWINNIMHRIEDGKLTKNKFIDFQLFFYQSPVSDLLFFLWSSVQLEILETEFQNLLDYYHNEFIECLRKLNCNTNHFLYEDFLEELDYVAPTNFMDIIYMTMFVVFGKKHPEDCGDVAGSKVVKEDVPKMARDKIAFMVHVYGKKGWIEG